MSLPLLGAGLSVDAPATTPVNTVAPVLSGMPTTGSTISVTNGTYTGGGSLTYSYQWFATDPDGDIGLTPDINANSRSLPTIGGVPDGTRFVYCAVTATNEAGSVTTNSNQIGPVTPTVIDYSSNVVLQTWTVPAGCTAAYFEGGGSGGNGGSTSASFGETGGGGGAYAKSFAGVTPADVINIYPDFMTLGAVGAGSYAAPASDPTNYFMYAPSGAAGSGATVGAGGLTTNAVANIASNSGGDGGARSATSGGGGGGGAGSGGAGGTGGNGGVATGGTAGAAGTTGGTAGGVGSGLINGTGGDGSVSSTVGGGSGGGGGGVGVSATHGIGGNGRVRVTY